MIVISLFLVYFIVLWFIKAFIRIRKEKRDNFSKYLNEIIHTVLIEEINGIEYWYDFDNSKFLGQGGTFEDALNVVKSRFPDHIFLFNDQGGLCAKTNWQIVPFDELKQLNFTTREGK